MKFCSRCIFPLAFFQGHLTAANHVLRRSAGQQRPPLGKAGLSQAPQAQHCRVSTHTLARQAWLTASEILGLWVYIRLFSLPLSRGRALQCFRVYVLTTRFRVSTHTRAKQAWRVRLGFWALGLLGFLSLSPFRVLGFRVLMLLQYKLLRC